MYVNRVKTRVAFKIQTAYKVEISSLENEEHLSKNEEIKMGTCTKIRIR